MLAQGVDNDRLQQAKTLGLFQGDKLKQPADAAYQRALEGYFRPFLMQVLVQEMAENSSHLNYLYETLKTYLMFYQPQHFDADDIQVWFSAYFDRNVPGKVNASIREQLNGHLATCLLYTSPSPRDS